MYTSNENFIPKESTQQIEFLKKYPEYDGRGIKIAIIDLDVVDTSLPGLQETTTGLPKIIKCSSKAKHTVDTSKIVERNGKNFIMGLTGQKLYIPIKWKNPSDKWHIGSIKFIDVCDLAFRGNKETFNKKEMDRIISLKNTIMDCIVWFDGEKWQTCLDTTVSNFLSNLGKVKTLSNYDDTNEFTHLIYSLKYCANVFEYGNLLNIMCPHNYHGTVVAHVAAAYFPDKPFENNGIAPGAQIVSLHPKNVEKALLKCIKIKVDIVNISISYPQQPCIVETIKKMVEEHGIIVTQSVGNLGPFYSSIPEELSDIADYIFIIGSIFDNEMKPKFPDYNESNNLPAVFNMSSRGPLLSGARGVDFVAPGAAITDLPKWCPSKNKSCSGTSFASPNAAGTIACLLSALKANSIPYTPAMIKAALANTAFLPEGSDRLAFGNGIIQINNAFEFIKKHANFVPIKFLMPFLMDKSDQKGVLLVHNDSNNNNLYDYSFNLDPASDRKWILKCITSDGNVDFVTHDKAVTNNLFNVKICTSNLEEGSLNYAEIRGIDSLNPSLGSLFCLPITVINPADAAYYNDKIITIKPGLPTHFYLKLPLESQKCYIKIISLDDRKESKGITLEYCQKVHIDWKFHKRTTNTMHFIEFTPKKKVETLSLAVQTNEEKCCQLCIYHNNLSTFIFKMKISFQQ